MAFERRLRHQMYDASREIKLFRALLEKCGHSPALTPLLAKLDQLCRDMWQEVNTCDPESETQQAVRRAIAQAMAQDGEYSEFSFNGLEIPPEEPE